MRSVREREKNRYYEDFPVLIMAFIFIGFLILIILSLMGATNATGGYLYNPGPDDDEKQSDVEPIIDYIQPRKIVGETDEDYDERCRKPPFLGNDSEDRIVEFYAPWCGKFCVTGLKV